MKTSEIIVAKILANIASRSGLGNEWDEIDDEIRLEIAQDLIKIVESVLDGKKCELQGAEKYYTIQGLQADS